MNVKSSKYQIYQIVISSFLLALSVVLGVISKFVPLFRMPSGGGINLAMVPLTLTGLILGPIYGTFIGLSYGVINMLIDGATSWGILCLLFDYFLAYSFAGITGLFRKYYFNNKTWSVVVSIFIFSTLRLVSHFLSGVIVFNDFINETGKLFSLKAISYSLLYNLSYLLPTMIISLIILVVLSKVLFKLNNTNILLKTLGKKYIQNDLTKSYSFINLYLLITSFIIVILSIIPIRFSDKDNIGLSFLSYFSLIISLYLIIYYLYCLKSKDNIIIGKENILHIYFKNSYTIYLIFIFLSFLIYLLSLLSITIFFI